MENLVMPEQLNTPTAQRFTLDGSDALEAHLAAVCDNALAGIRAITYSQTLEGLLLGGSYGRGEGGVYRRYGIDYPFNDLEFFVLLRGPCRWNEMRFGSELEKLSRLLSRYAGMHVEFKILSCRKLERTPVTMAFHDLVTGHRRLWGSDDLLKGCSHHRLSAKIPRYEAARLLLNRCSGLLFSEARLRAGLLGFDDKQFIARNQAKARMGLGDAVLTVLGCYHPSCRERKRRFQALIPVEGCPWFEQVRAEHEKGVEFKLHPTDVSESELVSVQKNLVALAREVWLWLERHRLLYNFGSIEDYSASSINKCPETRAWRNCLINGIVLKTISKPFRYPRERLFHALPLLLWEPTMLEHQAELRRLQSQLRAPGSSFLELTAAYEKLWNRFN